MVVLVASYSDSVGVVVKKNKLKKVKIKNLKLLTFKRELRNFSFYETENGKKRAFP